MIRFYSLSLIFIFGFNYGLSARQASPDSLMDSGIIFYENTEYKEAGEHFKEAMKLYLLNSDTVNWIEASFQYGSALVEQGFVREGIRAFKAIGNKSLPNNSLNQEARKANLLGWAYEKLEMPDSVKFYLSNGLELAEQLQDSLQIARISNNLSYYYQNEGDYERAFELQKKAIQYFTLINDQSRLSAVLNRAFLTMMSLGLHEQAEAYIRQSLAIREELGNLNLLDIAYHNLAWNFERQGKRDSSIIYYQKSLELSRQLGNPYDMTQTLENIGSLYERSGDFENALAYYNESLSINREIKRPVSTAQSLLRIARVAVQNNDLDNAAAFYHEALGWLEDAEAPRQLTSVYLDLADLETDQRNYRSAKEYITKARYIAEEKGFKTRHLRVFNSLGKLYKTDGDLHASLAAYRKAYELSSDNTIPEKISPAIHLARAYHEVSSDSAFIVAEEAFSLIDSMRTNVAGLAFRSGFFSQHAGFYNEVASWYITHKNNPAKAFQLIEAAKSRVLMDELAESREELYDTYDESTLIKKQQKAKKIDQLYNQLAAAKTESEKSTLRNTLKDLEFDYQSFLNQIHVSDDRLKNFKYPGPAALHQIQELLDDETAILEYAFTDRSLIRLLITNKSISGHLIDTDKSNTPDRFLTEQIRTYREAITNKEPVERIQGIGRELYAKLIPAELTSDQSTFSNLLFIPGGPLIFLPFESLSTNNRYLVEDFHIKYLPSASIYSYIKTPHRATNFELLAVAGSGFEGGDDLINTTSSQNSFASLPSTLLEVDSISVNFAATKILKNDDVTEAGVKSHDLSDFRFIHFATHAEVNESDPSQSGLLLSKKTDVELLFGEDGYLNSREISGLRLNADLVTLSACNTGMGKLVTGEGLLGLQRSFLSAGASSVMVSLWSVFDRSTSVFMSTFYKQMLAHEQEDYGIWDEAMTWFGMYEHPLFDYKAKALRDAKLSMIEHPYYSHPVYWAPFILIGK